jgi:hypothetical protein
MKMQQAPNYCNAGRVAVALNYLGAPTSNGDPKSSMSIREGQRVRITETYHWAGGATGEIMLHPANRSLTRKVRARVGEKTFVWIKFDNPQVDSDGDGPYRQAEVDLEFIENSN